MGPFKVNQHYEYRPSPADPDVYEMFMQDVSVGPTFRGPNVVPYHQNPLKPGGGGGGMSSSVLKSDMLPSKL